jgi:hypothetical protein
MDQKLPLSVDLMLTPHTKLALVTIYKVFKVFNKLTIHC